MQRRQPGARHVPARHRLGFAANDGMDDEFRGEIATGGGHDRAPDRQLAVQADAVLELFTAGDLDAPQRGGRGIEASGGGTDEGIGGERREIVHDYANHLPDSSRERRYIAVAWSVPSRHMPRRVRTMPRLNSASTLFGSARNTRCRSRCAAA